MSKPRLVDAMFLNDGSGKKLVEYNGLSTHVKPVEDNFAFGSSFFEVDTGNVYFFNEESQEWMNPRAQTATAETTETEPVSEG